MVEAAEIKPDDLLYEVGAGRGRLTSALLDRGADAVAFEMDPAMAGALPRHPRLSVRTEDFLAAAAPRADFAVVGNINAVHALAQARGVTMAQIALAWVLRNPLVSAPIVGATKPHHLTEAVAALDIDLTDDEAAALEKPYVECGPSWY